jgi:hypothetical protein
VDEVILRTLVLQFDGRVMEISGAEHSGVIRCHVALLKEPGRPATAANCPGGSVGGTT